MHTRVFHVSPCPGTKWISISDLRGIIAYELLRYVLHACIVSHPANPPVLRIPNGQHYLGMGVALLNLVLD